MANPNVTMLENVISAAVNTQYAHHHISVGVHCYVVRNGESKIAVFKIEKMFSHIRIPPKRT